MKKLGRNDACWCGSGKKYKHCHEALDERLMAESDKGHIVPTRDLLKTPEQIEKIRESCAVNIAVLDYVAEHIGAGITTEEIDKWVYDETVKRGGIPAPLGYEGFPKSVCTSINAVSYTHLDVYKRQISGGLIVLFLIFLVYPIGRLLK